MPMKWFLIVCIIIGSGWMSVTALTNPLLKTYDSFTVQTVTDRYHTPIYVTVNSHEQYFLPIDNYPEALKNIVIRKEDRFFYYHPGVNPFSLLRTIISGVKTQDYGGSSTITQQLVKILLSNTTDRSIKHKIKESSLAVALELRLSKKEILDMYLNSVYLGNQAQGFAQASWVYYGLPIHELSEIDLVSLAATLSSPSVSNPWEDDNLLITNTLATKLDIKHTTQTLTKTGYNFNSPAAFEVNDLISDDCSHLCLTTIDKNLTEQIRELAYQHTVLTSPKGGTEVAVVVIEIPSNQILAMVGSPDPTSRTAGAQINMTISPRPIGSTIKPFIYGLAFTEGARPYSLIEDREYKYQIGTGFPLYPKNFDGTYQGEVTLQTALSNSLNTPSIKLLEYVELENFYDLLEKDMSFLPINPLSSYAYGIALGGLEMDLLTLTHYFTTLANKGTLKPLYITTDEIIKSPQSTVLAEVEIFTPATVELINSILTDRQFGVAQFGLKSTLDVFGKEVAVKTGTSRDFHDNWTVGYTPDYVVGVWLGNAANEPMDGLSGSIGAGALWRQIMELMSTTVYDKDTAFSYQHSATYEIDNSLYRGLVDDDLDNHRYLLLEKNIILLPHHEDTFLFSPDTSIKLSSRTEVEWVINQEPIGTGVEIFWQPPTVGQYQITATTNTQSGSITIDVVTESNGLLP